MTYNRKFVDTPKLSIIVPVYNTMEYVVRCLESIRKQTFQDYEVLIINDGSTDDSENICRNYIRNNSKYRLINKPNGGLTSARFCGWKEAIGEYIVFVDSDDFIEPDYCKDLYDACETTNSHLAICSYQVVTENGISSIIHLPFSQSLITDVQNEYIKPLISYVPETQKRVPGFLWLRMMRRNMITEDCFVNENKVFTEDMLFDIFYARNISKIAVVQRPLYNYYQSAGSLTRKYRKGLWLMYKNLHEECSLFCEKNQVNDVLQYLSSLLLGGALHSTQQAAACLNYSDFKKDFQSIRNDSKINEIVHYIGLLSEQFRRLIINQKIIYLMIRFVHSRIVYYFYRWRQLR